MGETRVRKSKKKEKDLSKQTSAITGKLEDIKVGNDADDSKQTTEAAPPLNHTRSRQPLRSRRSAASISSERSEAGSGQSIDFIEVRDTDTKGQAAFATRKIRPGTLVLAERPLIRLTQAQEDADKDDNNSAGSQEEGKPRSALESAFTVLSRQEQKAYLKLFDSNKSGFSRVKSIYYSNCYNLSKSASSLFSSNTSLSTPASENDISSVGGSCIGLLASRLNHSCIPNVQFSFCPDRNLMLFHAIRPVPRGKEIVSNYESVYAVASARQTKVSMYYGFRCACEACEPPTEFWTKSDERRKGMIEVKRRLAEAEREYAKVRAVASDELTELAASTLDDLERLEGLLVKEGLLGTPLADVHGAMTTWRDRKGDKKGAKESTEKELDVFRTCLGKVSHRVRALEDRLVQIEKDIETESQDNR